MIDLGHLEGSGGRSGRRATAEWVVRADGPGASALVTVTSQKGGTDKKTVTLTASPSAAR